MSNEIKEILDYLKNDNYFTESPEYEVSPYDLFKSLNSVQTDKLLDYITNLQENYEKEHYLVDKLTRQLNDECKNTEYQCKQKEDYKSRCEKALITTNDLFSYSDNEEYVDNYCKKIMNELNGGSDE